MNHPPSGVRQHGDILSFPRLLKQATAVSATLLAMLSFGLLQAQAQAVDEIQAQLQAQHGPNVKVYPFRLKHGVDKTSETAAPAAPIRRSTITPGPAGAQLVYNGGPVVSTIKVAVVYYGAGSYLPQLSTSLPNFYAAISNGTYMDMLSEYSTQGVAYQSTTGNELIQRGGPNAFLGSFTITPSAANNAGTIADSNIQNELQLQIASGHLPTPDYDVSGDANTFYVIYFPPGKTITQGTSSSCVAGGFCAYHGTSSYQSKNILYGVQPDMQSGSGCYTGCGNSTVFNNYTSVASHEFAETITDPSVGIAISAGGPPLAWYDSTNGEIGDICNAIQGSADGFTVQAEWSNLQNGCALGPVYFTVATPSTATPGNAFSLTLTTKNSANATLAGYRGTVHLTSTDSSATLPADYTFVAADSGIHTFSGVVLRTTGNQTVSVNGSVSTGFKGTSPAVSVGGTVVNDFSISASPASLSVAQGASGSSSISTVVAAGSAGTVTLSVTGAPTGVTTTLNPASVTAGSNSTLAITTASTTVAGTYTLTITGTEGTKTHTATVALTVSTVGGGGGGGIVNGNFEAGNLNGWTVSGPIAAVTPSGHSGTYAAKLGSTNATNGDSSIAQTFTAPTGATAISFWYKVTCPDTVTYDWATATLTDNTASTTATVLPKTCTAAGVWTNVTASLVAGHGYTLTLTSHDDNYAGDPTYTLYDDVTITTATGGGGGGVTNGGFESGATGWLTAGTVSIATSGCHGGAQCAMAGSTGPTNGDSSFAQTFTVPTGKSQLSLWYKNTCPDSLTYDWATATLKNNTLGTTATVLPKTCTQSGAWANVTSAVTAGASYTLTLTSHDDNYAGDPTFTLYDDVTIN